MNMTTYVTDVIEGKRNGTFLKGALYAISGLFEAGVNLRNFAFDQSWLKEKKVEVPVISIGNIVAGGTGKTSLIQRLTKDLSSLGKVSILSRGYRSIIEKKGKSVTLLESSDTTPEICGDEPYLLFKTLPEAILFVGKDRVFNARQAVYHNTDWILLDDGMQYRSLHRDVEIVMLHADDLYGKGFFLPRGYLRDSPKRLQNADAIIINHIKNKEHFYTLQEEVRHCSQVPIIGTRMIPKEVEMFDGDRLKDLKGKRVGVFCGLGNPHSFFATVEEMGGEIMDTWILPDHVGPKIKELKKFSERCMEGGCDLVLCSEKDRVKLPLDLECSLPIGTVKAELQVVMGEELYEKLLQNIIGLRPKDKTR